MENQILEAISHIRKLVRKNNIIDRIIDRMVTQINNSAATNWDLESVKLCLNEMTAKIVINTKFAELKNSLMVKICDLKTNYAPDSESNSKKQNTLHKDQLIYNQNEEILFLRQENKNKNLIIKTLFENLELYNSQTKIRSRPCEQTFKEP